MADFFNFPTNGVELKVDGYNGQRVRNIGDETLVDILFDLRYAKGTGEVSIYHRMLHLSLLKILWVCINISINRFLNVFWMFYAKIITLNIVRLL